MGSGPTEQEIELLKRQAGKEISVTVFCVDREWDYGECKTSKSAVVYKMRLDDVDVEQLTGILVNDQHWGKKGKQISQRFDTYIPDEGAWMGGGSRTITRIDSEDGMLYRRGP